MEAPKVLIVDDDNDYRELLREYLMDIGLAVIDAASGTEAMNAALLEMPDVILLDVMLPDVNGIDTCRMLKSIESLKDVPILFLSARAGLEDKLHGYLAGAKKYITKPCDMRAIENSIRSAIPPHDMFHAMDNALTDDAMQYNVSEE